MMDSLYEQIMEKVKAVNLGDCADAGIEQYKEEMRQNVPLGQSPVKGGDWVDFYNERYARAARKNVSGPVNLNVGEARYVNRFNRVFKSENAAAFDYDSVYGEIAMQHQTGQYNRGNIKPRNLIPQKVDELPDSVFSAIKSKFIELFK